MPLRSAIDDFVHVTLGAVSGTWRRFVTVAFLKRGRESYHHWGLERTHGKDSARDAMQSAHQEVFLDLLRTPIQEVDEQQMVDPDPEADSRKLLPEAIELAPSDPGGGSKAHLRWLLRCLSFLRQNESKSRHPGA